jgi:hypothetical protein
MTTAKRSSPPLSMRHATGVCALLTLALVPTIIHGYVGLKVTDARTVTRIERVLANYPSESTTRAAAWFEEQFAATESFERQYHLAGASVTLTAIRSYDLPTLYHHPELVVAYHTHFEHTETRRLASAPDMPIHVLHSSAEEGAPSIGLYVLQYDDRFVDDPIVFQLRTAVELLLTGRRPMTLIFAQQTGGNVSSVDDTAAAHLLVDAVRGFSGDTAGVAR